MYSVIGQTLRNLIEIRIVFFQKHGYNISFALSYTGQRRTQSGDKMRGTCNIINYYVRSAGRQHR